MYKFDKYEKSGNRRISKINGLHVNNGRFTFSKDFYENKHNKTHITIFYDQGAKVIGITFSENQYLGSFRVHVYGSNIIVTGRSLKNIPYGFYDFNGEITNEGIYIFKHRT